MADPRALLVSILITTRQQKILFVGQAKNSKTPFSIQDWSANSSLPQAQWEAIVKEKINKCNILIVLVGKTMASASVSVRGLYESDESVIRRPS